MFGAFPMILIAVILYNLTMFGGGAAGHDIVALLDQNFTLPMFSGDKWKISLGDPHRQARDHQSRAIDADLHRRPGGVPDAQGLRHRPFFFIMAMCLFDVVAGYTISIVAAKRDFSVSPHGSDY